MTKLWMVEEHVGVERCMAGSEACAVVLVVELGEVEGFSEQADLIRTCAHQ